MINATFVKSNTNDDNCYYVVHPLFDKQEEKLNTEDLGPMKLSPVVKYSLLSLRLYLLLMGGLVVYRIIQVTGLI